MDFNKIKNNFSTLKKSSMYLLVSNSLLVMMLGVSLTINMLKDTIVINNMNETCEYTELSSTGMNEETHKRLGFYIAGLIGNVTPENAVFVKEAVLSFASPELYNQISDKLAVTIQEFIDDEITMSFTPETFLMEDGVVFVTGKGTIQGRSGQVKKYTRTYEFVFEVSNYTPSLTYIDVYNDIAHDSLWKAKNAKKSAKAKGE